MSDLASLRGRHEVPQAVGPRVAAYGPVVALIVALITVLPGTPDPEAFATGREVGVLACITLALVVRAAVDDDLAVDAADGWALAVIVGVFVSALVADIRPLGWRLLGHMIATMGMWLAIRRCPPVVRWRIVPWTLVALSVVVAAVSWAEALGWLSGLSQPGRAPGGLFGNRNRMAHVLALGLPSLLALASLRSRRRQAGLVFLALLVVTSMLVLARSRTAWIGCGVGGGVFLAGLAIRRRSLPISRPRLALATLGIGVGVCLAVTVPTTLRWRTAHPYRDSVRNLANLREGSGRVRLIQQQNTLRMLRDTPWFGVGPGGWHVAYAKYATPGDATFVPQRRTPTSRLPHGDWLGLAAECGVLVVLALVGFFAVVVRALLSDTHRAAPPEAHVGQQAALATLATLLVLGLSDPVFITTAPAAITMAVLGAWTPRGQPLGGRRFGAVSSTPAVTAIILVSGLPLAFAARHAYGDYRRRTATSPADLQVAARWSVANFDARLGVAEAYVRAGACEQAIPFAVQAYRLDPSSTFPVRVLAHCQQARSPLPRP